MNRIVAFIIILILISGVFISLERYFFFSAEPPVRITCEESDSVENGYTLIVTNVSSIQLHLNITITSADRKSRQSIKEVLPPQEKKTLDGTFRMKDIIEIRPAGYPPVLYRVKQLF